MKRIIALILCVLMLIPVGIGTTAYADNAQATCDAYVTDAVVKIDGVKESIWKNAPSFNLENVRKNYLGDGDLIESESVAEVKISLMWDETRIASENRSLYVLVEVKDSTPYTSNSSAWENDSFEMWIRYKDETKKMMIERDGSTNGFVAAGSWPWREAKVTNTETGWIAEYRVELNYQQVNAQNASRPDWTGSTMYVDFIYNDATQAKGGRIACLGWCDNENTTAANATTETLGICKLSTTVAKGVIDYAEGLPELSDMTESTFANATSFMVVGYSNAVVARVTYTPIWDGTNLYVLAKVLQDKSPYWGATAAYQRDAFWVNLTVDGVDAKLRVDRGGATSGYVLAKMPWLENKVLSTGNDGFSVVYKIALSYNETKNDDSSKPVNNASVKMKFNYLNATNDNGTCTTVSSKGLSYELAPKSVVEQPPVEPDSSVSFKGYQMTTATDKTDDGIDNKTYGLRLVAVLTEKDLSEYASVGFEVRLTIDGKSLPVMKQDIHTVYQSIVGKTGSGYTEYTAESLGGEYIFALNCNNIPTTKGDIEFTVTPYYTLKNDDKVYFGETKMFVVVVEDMSANSGVK